MDKGYVNFIIYGEPASKANSRKLDDLMEGELKVTITIWYASRRPDLDESVILDAMEGHIYKNDRQVREKHIYWGLDPLNPRADITVDFK